MQDCATCIHKSVCSLLPIYMEIYKDILDKIHEVHPKHPLLTWKLSCAQRGWR